MSLIHVYRLTVAEVWLKVLEPMERMRRESDLVKVFPSYLSGEDLFGLTEMAVIWVIESVRDKHIYVHEWSAILT